MNVTKLDSFDTLIRALDTYREDMHRNCNILKNAGDLCEATMQKDDISTTHVENLKAALVHLNKTILLAEGVQEALREELRRLYEIYNA